METPSPRIPEPLRQLIILPGLSQSRSARLILATCFDSLVIQMPFYHAVTA